MLSVSLTDVSAKPLLFRAGSYLTALLWKFAWKSTKYQLLDVVTVTFESHPLCELLALYRESPGLQQLKGLFHFLTACFKSNQTLSLQKQWPAYNIPCVTFVQNCGPAHIPAWEFPIKGGWVGHDWGRTVKREVGTTWIWLRCDLLKGFFHQQPTQQATVCCWSRKRRGEGNVGALGASQPLQTFCLLFPTCLPLLCGLKFSCLPSALGPFSLFPLPFCSFLLSPLSQLPLSFCFPLCSSCFFQFLLSLTFALPPLLLSCPRYPLCPHSPSSLSPEHLCLSLSLLLHLCSLLHCSGFWFVSFPQFHSLGSLFSVLVSSSSSHLTPPALTCPHPCPTLLVSAFLMSHEARWDLTWASTWKPRPILVSRRAYDSLAHKNSTKIIKLTPQCFTNDSIYKHSNLHFT